MITQQGRCLTLAVLATLLLLASRCSSEAPVEQGQQVIRLAELEIDPAQIDSYKAALKEEIESSIRLEPGVLTLYAVSVKGHPNQIRLFERYRNTAAYQSHLQTSHFQKYKRTTQDMVKSLNLIETDPIFLGAKAKEAEPLQ